MSEPDGKLADVSKVSPDEVRGAVEYGCRKFGEPIWADMDPIVDVVFRGKLEGINGAFKLDGTLKSSEEGKELEEEVIATSGYLATLPTRLVSYVLQGLYDEELQEPEAVLAPDGRLVVDDKARFGVEVGLTVGCEAGSSLALDAAFREVRRRIWDAAAACGVDPVKVKGFSLWHPTSLGALTLGTLDCELPARIAGSRVRRVESSWLGEGAVYVLAHAYRRVDKPFEWLRQPGLTIAGAKDNRLFDRSFALRTRVPWGIAKIEMKP